MKYELVQYGCDRTMKIKEIRKFLLLKNKTMDYKEKLEFARDWYNDQSTTKKEKVLLENLFPELAEKPQPQWKPTEDQINCFKQAIDLFKMKVNDDAILRILISLYDDLKNFEQ